MISRRCASLLSVAYLPVTVMFGALPQAHADVFRPAYLEFKQRADDSYEVLWKVPALGQEARLALELKLPADCEYLSGPNGSFEGGAHLQRSRIRCHGGLTGHAIRIRGLAGSSTEVLARVERQDGTTQVARLLPANPGFMVEVSATASDTAWTYFKLGVHHILTGADHLLFVLGLIVLVNSVRRLMWTVTAFTIAHIITLAAATLGLVQVPQLPVEAVIALSIVFVVGEIVHAHRGRPGVTLRLPWLVAFIFGLLHGLGFAGALREVGLPQKDIPVALFTFNIGVEAGQLLFIAAVLAVAAILKKTLPRATRAAPVAIAYAIGSVASFWTIARLAAFW